MLMLTVRCDAMWWLSPVQHHSTVDQQLRITCNVIPLTPLTTNKKYLPRSEQNILISWSFNCDILSYSLQDSRFLSSRMATEIPPPVVELMEEAKNVSSGEECFAGSSELGVDVTGLVAIIIFYAAVLAVGIWASWRTRKSEQNQEQVGGTGWHQSRS